MSLLSGIKTNEIELKELRDITKEGGYIGVAQLNPRIGNLEYNSKKIADCIRYAESINLDLVVFPELAIIGTPFGNLLDRYSFLADENYKWLKGLAKITKNTTALISFFDKTDNSDAVAVLNNGKIEKVLHSNSENKSFSVNKVTYGCAIRDLTHFDDNTDVNILIKSYPDKLGERNLREKRLSELFVKYKKPLIYVNQTGATDDLSYDGASCGINEQGIYARAKSFDEDFIILNPLKGIGEIEPLPGNTKSASQKSFTSEYESDLERTYKSIIQGIKDYFNKCGLKRAVLGLSGGLDSTVCAVLLVDALGKENVIGVSMPSKLTSKESKSDAQQLAENLGIHFADCSIKPMFETTKDCLEPLFQNIEQSWSDRYKNSYTPDNIQARARATYLWCISNEFPSCIPIATSDKSETYMGYATINGDMSGGFAPIADVTKTKLFALARWLNKNRAQKNAIPESVILKRPGAELAIDPKTGKTLCAEDALMPSEFMDEVIWRIETKKETYQDMLNSKFCYENKFNISKEQKTEWLNKFFKRMSVGGYKLSIMPPSVLTDSHSVNKFDYHQPITSCGINYKGTAEEEIFKILEQ